MPDISSFPSLSRRAALLAGLATLTGCASTAKQVAIPYAVRLAATADVNPDANRRPSPIQVTVYELRSASSLETSDFFRLQADPKATLGADLLSMEQIILRPGQQHTLRRAGHVDARQIAVVAAYRDLERSRWRLVVPLPGAKQTNFYKFWQFSPGEHAIDIRLDATRVAAIESDR